MKGQKISVWLCGIASFGLSTVTLIAYQPNALAGSLSGSCSIPDGSFYTDKKYNSLEVEQSFLNSDCMLITLAQDTTFFRYYSFPSSPAINIGRYLTTDAFELNSEAIVKLALFPFPPNVQFQNFAYYRETVNVLAGTPLYSGTAGPQPYDKPNSCYAGGATQYFFAGENISNNTNLTFTFEKNLTKDTRYPNTYGVGDPCQKVPEPSPLTGLGAIAVLGLVAGFNRGLTQAKSQQKINR
jgi:hypothetical protein